MTDPIEPLKELARTLRAEGLHEHNGQPCAETDAADRIESLVPALEAAFAEQETEIAALKNGPTHAEAFQSGRNSRDKEVAALKEPMACGHPKACIEIRQYDYGDNVKDSATGNPPTVSAQFCTACEHERLVRAAALRPMAEIAGRIKKYFSCVGSGEQALKFAEDILALIPPADRSALDAHDAEVWNQALDRACLLVDFRGFKNTGESITSDSLVRRGDISEAIRALKRGSK